MAVKYGKKKKRSNNILNTVVAAIFISAVFLMTVSYFYITAEKEEEERLHLQTKQIKDNIILQLESDRENLDTMANFAANLYQDNQSYDRMLESFKPIGLFSNIGILNPDNTFVTRTGTVQLDSKEISFEDEIKKGKYVSGRVKDLTGKDIELIRSAVPIVSEGETVGILYGVIRLETLKEKYSAMAKELDAQLFVYNKETGKFLINTAAADLGQVSDLKSRQFNDGYTYEQLLEDKGFSSFKSIKTGEDMYVHYSTIDDFGWGIMLARYETQVFEKTHAISKMLFVSFAVMVVIIALYLILLLRKERTVSNLTSHASNIRKLLLEANRQNQNVVEALKRIREISSSRSAFFVDTDSEDYNYIMPRFKDELITGEDKKHFIGELFRYSASLHNIDKSAVGIMRIIPGKHLVKTNPEFSDFLKQHKIKEIVFAGVTEKNNHVSILGVINPGKSNAARALIEDIAVCFSIAIFNKKHLNKTELAASTDSLTGVLNRVSFKSDILSLDEEKPMNFACVYIDVNELHMINNKYGHAAGDEMLIYIANTLKEAFFGHKVYRMGGDEFLVFAKDTNQDQIKKSIDTLTSGLEIMNYNVSVGTSFRSQNTNCEEMVREAEIRMYEAKARYYQAKEQSKAIGSDTTGYVHTKTGIREIDTMISILKEHYNGIYRVSLADDSAHRILMPSYLGYNESEHGFSKLLKKYITDAIHPDFHRSVEGFLNYDAIRRHLLEGNIPKISFKKIGGETVVLSVYRLDDDDENANETLWVFEKA